METSSATEKEQAKSLIFNVLSILSTGRIWHYWTVHEDWRIVHGDWHDGKYSKLHPHLYGREIETLCVIFKEDIEGRDRTFPQCWFVLKSSIGRNYELWKWDTINCPPRKVENPTYRKRSRDKNFSYSSNLAWCRNTIEGSNPSLLDSFLSIVPFKPLPTKKLFGRIQKLELFHRRFEHFKSWRNGCSGFGVKKEDSTFRFCIDFKPLNKITKHDWYPLEHIDNLIDQIRNSRYFISRYWHSNEWRTQFFRT